MVPAEPMAWYAGPELLGLAGLSACPCMFFMPCPPPLTPPSRGGETRFCGCMCRDQWCEERVAEGRLRGDAGLQVHFVAAPNHGTRMHGNTRDQTCRQACRTNREAKTSPFFSRYDNDPEARFSSFHLRQTHPCRHEKTV